MEKKELAKQIYEAEKQMESNQNKRNAITIAIFALVFFWIFYLVGKPAGLYAILGTAVVSLVASVVHFLINAAVFGALYERSEAERRAIKRMEEKYNNTTL